MFIVKNYRSLREQNDFVEACEQEILCAEEFCPYMNGTSGRLGACEGDFCEYAWDAYCEKYDKEY